MDERGASESGWARTQKSDANRGNNADCRCRVFMTSEWKLFEV